MVFYYLLLLLVGFIFGSFLTSFTYRITKGELLPKGRSYCPKCKKNIAWYDNIPLISYLFLYGKCRYCKKEIPLRYLFIEISTAGLFILMGTSSISFHGGSGGLLFLLFITLLSFAILIIDFEHQVIPDELSFTFLVASFAFLIISGSQSFYVSLFSGLGASLFLLILHLATLGRGMGLGDVKLALGIGLLLGWPDTILWLLTSFVLGAFVGIILIIFGKSKLGKNIAFGPFLVASFFAVLLWGDSLQKVLVPYL